MENRTVIALIALAGGLSSAFADDPVAPDQLAAAVQAAVPGDTIIIAEGIYPDQVLKLSGKGSKEAPVTIKAQTPGRVVFTGESAIELSGENLVLDGLWFRDGYPPGKEALAIRGSHCRLTNTLFDAYNAPDPEAKEEKWVTLRGQYHQVDHCTFYGKTSRSVTLTVWREKGRPDHHRIEKNYFLVRTKGEKGNGYETIRIGTSEEAESDSMTLVKSNLFEACDGEMEAVSIKAGKCRIEDNTFMECAGTLTLRHGNGSVVVRNLFAGKKKPHTGGVRVYGADHQILGNMFIGLTGRGGAALALQTGTSDPPLNGFQAAKNILIEGNLFAANEGPALKLDEAWGEDGRKELPQEIVVRGNVFTGDEVQDLISGAGRSGIGVQMGTNQVFANNQIPSDITASLPPPLTLEDVGATWFNSQLQ